MVATRVPSGDRTAAEIAGAFARISNGISGTAESGVATASSMLENIVAGLSGNIYALPL
ncbi:MAG: hypothetical protein WBL20_11825 [Sphingobium sp.]